MATITLRSIKGSPLTIQEADSNFINLNTEIGQKLDTSEYTAGDILTKIKTVDGDGSGLDADLLDGLNSTPNNVSSSIVARDSSGNFSANTITSSLIGNVTGNVTGNVNGTVTGNATNVTGIVAVNNGGTGATNVAAARTNLGLGTLATQSASDVSISGGTITNIVDLSIADGGTGASTATQARTNLGLVIGSDVQPFDGDLTAISSLNTTGLIVRTGNNTMTTRSIIAGTNITSVTNGNGISGDITINATLTPTVSSVVKTGTSGTGDIGQTDNRFNIVYATTTTATGADLAEKYTTDREYPVGTVLVVCTNEFREAEECQQRGARILGVVSDNPGFLMNDSAPGQALALRGRVPVRVVGPISKGQTLIANNGGTAIAGDSITSFAIALKSDHTEDEKLVECVIL
jgi:hypothetical protein